MATRRARRRGSEKNEPNPAPQKPWTVMVYMAASQDEQTEAAAIRDLKELEKIGTTKNVNVVVQVDRMWPGYSERYRVWKGGSEPYGSYPSAENLKTFFPTGDPTKLGEFYEKNAKLLWELFGVENENEFKKCFSDRDPDVLSKAFSTGNLFVLRDFVLWARDQFPENHYLLVMWGHAFGLGFGRDHGDPLTMPELATALKTSVNVEKDEKLIDILGANACAMSYAEAAYELRDAAHFLVAPEIAMPFAGWPYQEILNEIDGRPDISPKDLGKKIIDLFIASFNKAFEPRSVALTLLNLEKAGELKPRLADVVDALDRIIDRNGVRDEVANAFLDTEYGDVRPLIDLSDLCDRLKEMKIKDIENTDSERIATAVGKMKTFLRRGEDELIVHHKSLGLEELHGLGIFAPSVSSAAELTRLELSEKDYRKLSLVTEKETGWADLVYEGLKDALEPLNQAVTEFVNGTGAVTREDRSGVAQLLLSVLRSFAQFESTVTEAEKKVMNVLEEKGSVKAATPKGKTPGKGKTAAKKDLTTEGRTVFGWPVLLLANGQPSSSTEVAALLAGTRAAVVDPFADEQLREAVTQLANIEDAVARLEKTTRKVLTNSRLGLGAAPPKPEMGAPKPEMGAPKPEMGAPKPEMGAPKPEMGLLSGSMLFDNAGSMAKVIGLFREVVLSLQLVEEAVGKLEGVVQIVLTSPTNVSNGSKPGDYQRRLGEQVKGAFRDVTDAAVYAKLTLGAVLQHPSQGLGPTQGGLGGAERQQLAMFGGLSSRNLRLL